MSLKDDRYTVKELMRELGVSQKTLYRWRKTKKGPRWFRMSPGEKSDIFYLKSEVLKWRQGL